MQRGLEIDLHLRPGLTDDGFVAEALGNLTAYRVAASRGERLAWQVLRVEGSSGHHFRLVLRHPDRLLDLGFRPEVETTLRALSEETVANLHELFDEAVRRGMRPVPLRTVRADVDFWQDDFWNWFG